MVRGRDLAAELIGRISFTDHFWLLLTGGLPSAAQRRVLDATLVAIAEHGLVPSVQASRMTLPPRPKRCKARLRPASSAAARWYWARPKPPGTFLPQIAASCVDAGTSIAAQRQASSRIPRRRARDPRLRPSAAQARRSARAAPVRGRGEAGAAGTHVEIARTVERCCRSSSAGRWRSMSPARFPQCCSMPATRSAALKGVPILARTAGLIAHLLEEQQRPIGFVHVACRRPGDRLRRRRARGLQVPSKDT